MGSSKLPKLAWITLSVIGIFRVSGQSFGPIAPIIAPTAPVALPAGAVAGVAAPAPAAIGVSVGFGGYGPIGVARPPVAPAYPYAYVPAVGYGYTVGSPGPVALTSPVGLASPYGR